MKKNFKEKCDMIYKDFIDNRIPASPPELIFMRLKTITAQHTSGTLNQKQKDIIKGAFSILVGLQLNYIKLQVGYQAIYRVIENTLDPTYKKHPKKNDSVSDVIDQQYLF